MTEALGKGGEARSSNGGQGVHGVVLAGAFRWGESQFERLGPKPALPVGLVPLVAHVAAWLRECGVTRVTVCTNGASAREVRRALAAAALDGVDLDYVDDWTPRGAAGCVLDAARESSAQTLLVTDGTIVPALDAADLLAQHRRSGAAATVAVSRDHGISETGRLLAPLGVYAFDRRVLAHISEVGYQDIKETLVRKLHAAGEQVVPYVADDHCPRVTSARSLLAANAWVTERMIARPWAPEGFVKRDGGLVHTTATVAASATLVGPFLIGPGACVEAGAVIVGPAVIGEGARVRDGALCARSVLESRATLEPRASADRCVLGAESVATAGSYLYEAVVPPASEGRSTTAAAAAAAPSRDAATPLPPRRAASGRRPRDARAAAERRA